MVSDMKEINKTAIYFLLIFDEIINNFIAFGKILCKYAIIFHIVCINLSNMNWLFSQFHKMQNAIR